MFVSRMTLVPIAESGDGHGCPLHCRACHARRWWRGLGCWSPRRSRRPASRWSMALPCPRTRGRTPTRAMQERQTRRAMERDEPTVKAPPHRLVYGQIATLESPQGRGCLVTTRPRTAGGVRARRAQCNAGARLRGSAASPRLRWSEKSGIPREVGRPVLGFSRRTGT